MSKKKHNSKDISFREVCMKEQIIKTEILVKENKIGIIRIGNVNYISLTDLAKYQNSSDPSFTVKNWLRRVTTIDYVGLWEQIHNENFNLVEFDQIKTEYGKNSFAMSPSQWIKRTNAIGIISKGGRYSIGTYAHPDISFEFASWLSPEFKLYLITEFERLKTDEAYQKQFVYAEEADVLNVALFGMTAKEWREKNPELSKKGNIRDYTDLLHLVILNNLQNINAELIENKIPQKERLIRLNNSAKRQMKVLRDNKNIKELEELQREVNNFKMLN